MQSEIGVTLDLVPKRGVNSSKSVWLEYHLGHNFKPKQNTSVNHINVLT